jgi:hypothetical protein
MHKKLRPVIALLLVACSPARAENRPTRDEVLAATLAPYAGPVTNGVDTKTLTGKIMCGYQGWFNCEGDGANRGWVHWTKGGGIVSPSNVKVDLWPDVSELGADEKFDTALHFADGRTAQVFSSFKKETVLRHFQWMRDYGIDGAFVQRFAGVVLSPSGLLHDNTVLANCREGANRNGRTYAVMYDFSGINSNRINDVMDDWRNLRTRMKLCDDPAYLHHRGKPVVTVWGVGFNDDRKYTIADCKRFIEFLKADGCTVMLGVPTHWRELNHDATRDPALHDVIALADIVSPWAVGRLRNTNDVAHHAEHEIRPDIAWCAERKLDYMPVVYPGFSWHNMYGKALNDIPRNRGQFFWSQITAAKTAGATMLYVAMFDEVDEGTAIFKCVNETPGDNFVTYEGLPSDYYLRIAGQAGKLMRGEIAADAPLPKP